MADATQVPVNCERLTELVRLAIRNGNEDAGIAIVRQWSEVASVEVVRLREQNADLLAACKAMLAEKDAVQTDQQACRRLYNAWLDMRDAVNRAEGRHA